VRVVAGRLDCEARFGFLSRDRATWGVLLGSAAVTTSLLLTYGVAPIPVALGFLGLTSVGGLNVRYHLTEACITRIHSAWAVMAETGGGPPSEMRLLAPDDVLMPLSDPPREGLPHADQNELRER
jgi:hypothetical protein